MKPVLGRRARRRVRAAVAAIERIVGGFATAVLAMAALFWALAVAVLCLIGIGLALAPGALRTVRAAADRERARLSRQGPEILPPGPVPDALRPALRDPVVRRELAWVAVHATWGFVAGIAGLSLPLYALQDTSFPAWAWMIPADLGAPGLVFWPVDTVAGVLAVGLFGIFWLGVVIVVCPWLARAQAWPGRRLLTPPPSLDLSLRVAGSTRRAARSSPPSGRRARRRCANSSGCAASAPSSWSPRWS